jgi:hypothetical protein
VVGFDPANAALLNAFRSKYNVQAGTPVVGPYNGKLDNSNESVELAKPDAPQTVPGPDFGLVPYVLVDKVRYSDLAPWPNCGPNCGPDGGGQSLQRINLNEYGNDPINWQAGSPNPGPQGSSSDSDSDGMLDSWEQQYGLIVGVNDSQGDLDGDGLKNIAEFLAGTLPNDPNSNLRLRVSIAAGALLQFDAAANISYVIEYKNALVPGLEFPVQRAGWLGPADSDHRPVAWRAALLSRPDAIALLGFAWTPAGTWCTFKLL